MPYETRPNQTMTEILDWRLDSSQFVEFSQLEGVAVAVFNVDTLVNVSYNFFLLSINSGYNKSFTK